MTPEQLTRLRRWFNAYVAGFYRREAEFDRNIRLKEEHTRRVGENIRLLADSLALPPSEARLAEGAALLHDVGRFEQYRRWRTFNDRRSVNHARIGLRTIGHHRLLAALPRTQRRRIARAVAFHNAAHLPGDEPAAGLRLMRLLRDADKLDIWQVVLSYYQREDPRRNPTIELDLPDTPLCSPAVLARLAAGRFVLTRDLRTLNDFKLLQISWVYDLNFPASFEAVHRRRYIERIAATLPDTPAVAAVVARAAGHVRRMRNADRTHPLSGAEGSRSVFL